VTAGQLLAELDTPEVDREIEQARASLARAEASIVQAAATLEFTTSTSKRYASLAKEGLISRQELDERLAQANVDTASVRVAEAERNARRADLRRLEQLQSFARVVSPFAGTVSARNVERGTLVNAGAANPLFEVVALDPVRVFLQVPQSLVQDIKPGLAVEIRLNEYPNESFPGELTRSSGTLDPDSRTMNVEVRAPNPEGKLLPGMYASVRIGLTSSRRLLILPATAIMNQTTGSFVAVVDGEHKVRLRPVEIERDSGAEVELGSGLNGDEQVIGAPGPDIVEGLSVQIAG
jgi:RND family efflux transporter MFP subunit